MRIAAVLLGLVASAAAWAQDPALPEAPAATPDPPPAEPGASPAPAADAAYEVTVYGEAAIRDARSRVNRAFEAEGWRVKDRGDQVVYKGPRAWMGKGHLDKDTGAFTFTQPVVTIFGLRGGMTSAAPAGGTDGATTDEGATLQTTAQALPPAPTLSLQLGFPSHRKVIAKQERLFADVRGELQAYGDVIRATRFQERLQELPDRLDACWRTGAPLEGEASLATPEERRAAILAFWATRSDTPEGDAVTHAVEVWIAETLDAEGAPVTDAEAAAAEANRADGRKLPR